jgi:diacylglycerol kinase family enzyme
MKILFVVNPIAGGKDHATTIQSLEEVTVSHGHKGKILLTSGDDDEWRIQREIKNFKPDRVIVGGGDGTIRMAAKILIEFQLSLGILPLGSANGLATALAIPPSPVEALEKILSSTHIRKMDMLKFNDEHLCIHLADIGANALLVKKYEEAGDRGMIGYAKYLVSSIQESSPMRIVIRTTDGITKKEGVLMAFANAHKYGTGVQISEGSVSDGKFEICNVERFALDDAFKAGLTILNVFVDKNMFSDVISCSEAEIEIDQKTHFQIDGEYMGMVDHLKIEIIPSCIKLLV